MNTKSLLLMLLGLALATEGIQAFSLTPMAATLDPKGNGAAKSFRVENESSNRVDFQITMFAREMDIDGKETNQPVPNLFTVFPPQGTVGPGQNQTVRIVWKGDKNPTNELCFRIEAVELPINRSADRNKAEIKVVLRYMGVVYVRPKNTQPKLRVTDFTRTETNTYHMVVMNTGNAHQPLHDPVLTLTDSQGRTIKVPTEQLSSIAGQNILGNHTRRYTLTLPPDLTGQRYEAVLTTHE